MSHHGDLVQSDAIITGDEVQGKQSSGKHGKTVGVSLSDLQTVFMLFCHEPHGIGHFIGIFGLERKFTCMGPD